MPWLATVSKSEVKSSTALSDMNNNPTSPVGFNIGGNTSIANLFAGYTNLTTFVGKGLMMYLADGVNVSVVDYPGLFDGCSALTSVDLTGWDMLSNSNSAGFNIRNMFNGCTSLLTVKASDRVVLFVNASHSSGLDTLNGRGNNNGVWERTNASATDPWFGTSLNLVTRYNTDTSKFRIHGEATYVFNTSYRGGRFDNDNTWWKVVTGANAKTLTVGADALEPNEVANFQIDWDVTSKGDLPWTQLFAKNEITSIETKGQAAPLNLYHWFMGYTNLRSFDGSGLDTPVLHQLLRGAHGLLGRHHHQHLQLEHGLFHGCQSRQHVQRLHRARAPRARHQRRPRAPTLTALGGHFHRRRHVGARGPSERQVHGLVREPHDPLFGRWFRGLQRHHRRRRCRHLLL